MSPNIPGFLLLPAFYDACINTLCLLCLFLFFQNCGNTFNILDINIFTLLDMSIHSSYSQLPLYPLVPYTPKTRIFSKLPNIPGPIFQCCSSYHFQTLSLPFCSVLNFPSGFNLFFVQCTRPLLNSCVLQPSRLQKAEGLGKSSWANNKV